MSQTVMVPYVMFPYDFDDPLTFPLAPAVAYCMLKFLHIL